MTARKIQATKNYRLFKHSGDNRPLSPKKHKKLHESMQTYGFLPEFPIVCGRDANGNLIVKDGQHRLHIAEAQSLPVYWVEQSVDFDIALINCTGVGWQLRDYASKHGLNGATAYTEGLAFADDHGLPVGTAFALLAGTTTFTNCHDAFVDGTFKIKDRKWAESVAGIYGPITAMAKELRTARFIEACMGVCRVKDFEGKRLIDGAKRCREKLIAYATKDAYLAMIEEIYNFGRTKLVSLRLAAQMAMRERSVVNGKPKPAAAGPAETEAA